MIKLLKKGWLLFDFILHKISRGLIQQWQLLHIAKGRIDEGMRYNLQMFPTSTSFRSISEKDTAGWIRRDYSLIIVLILRGTRKYFFKAFAAKGARWICTFLHFFALFHVCASKSKTFVAIYLPEHSLLHLIRFLLYTYRRWFSGKA